MKNKILLIDPQKTESRCLPPPLGLLSIGTVLKNNGYEVKIIRITEENSKKIEKYIDENVLCIGFGVTTNQVKPALKTSEFIKDNHKDIKVVWGGSHVNIFYYNRLIKSIFQTNNKTLHKFFSNSIVYEIMTKKFTISFIGMVIGEIVENKLFDKYIIKKIIGRSLTLEK